MFLEQPNWRGRRRYWEVAQWTRVPEGETAVGLLRKQHPNGWNNYYFMMFRRFGEEKINLIPVLNQSVLTSPTGSLQTTNGGVDASWNNNANYIHVIAGGGSGGIGQHAASRAATGGGGGEWGLTQGFQIANPGTTTFSWQIGIGGAAVVGTAGTTQATAGNDGGDTWWNGASQAAATIGAIHGNGGGATGSGVAVNGGAGGTGGVGSSHNAGGRGGNATASSSNGAATGGGGAGGFHAAGSQGVDTASASGSTNGGQGDGTFGGSAGTGTTTTPGGTGGNGSEYAANTGSGGGGGACRQSTNARITAGSGGNYGSGGGAAVNPSATASAAATSGAGIQGLIVLVWVPGGWGFAGTEGGTTTPYKQMPRTSQRYAGAKGKTGFLAPASWQNSGWEQIHTQPTRKAFFKSLDIGSPQRIDAQVTPPPSVPWFETSPALIPHIFVEKRGAIGGRFGAAFPPPWVFMGWEQVQALTRKAFFKSPDIGWPQGIDAAFVPPVATTVWGYEFQPTSLKILMRRVAIMRGSDGIEGVFHYIPWGYDPPPHFYLSKHPAASLFRGHDGTDAPYVAWRNAGWEVQYRDIKTRPRNPAALFRGHDGTDYPFLRWFNAGWEVQSWQPPHRGQEKRGAGFMQGDVGAYFTLVNFFPFGWAIQAWQPPTPTVPTAKHGAIMHGDDGIYLPFNFVPPPPVTGIFGPALLGVTMHVGRSGYVGPMGNPV